MTTSAVRAGLIVAAVVLGAIILANAFPKGGAGPGAAPAKSESPSSTPSTNPPTPRHHHRACKAEGVHLAVENATSTNGLAGATAIKLQKHGYVIKPTDILTAATQAQTTTVYYRGAAEKADGRCLVKKFFKNATLTPLPTGTKVGPLVQVAVFLGADYAASHPVQ